MHLIALLVIPAQAGIQGGRAAAALWTPAFAGATNVFANNPFLTRYDAISAI
jgi:hypothetical protein